MNKNSISGGIIGLIIGLIVGFAVANSINRNSAATATLSANPNNPNPSLNQPNITVKDPPQSGMMPDVAAVIEKAQNAPDDFKAQTEAGDMYLQIKRFDKAVEFYEKALQANPDDYETLVKLANSYFDTRQFEKAEGFYTKALAKNPKDINVRTDLGITFVERENPDYDRAIKEFRASLESNPKHEPTLYNLAIAYHKKGNAEETEKVLKELEAINPQSQLVSRLRQVTAKN